MHRPQPRGPRRGMSARQAILLSTAIACILLLLTIVIYLMWERVQEQKTEVLTAPHEVLYEGGVSVEQVNLASLTIQQSGQTLALQLGFQGYDSQGRSVRITSIPRVSIYGLRQPTRIAIELPNLVGWDYLETLDLSGQDFIQGVFLHAQTLYLQLRFDVSVSLEGQGGVLRMKIKRALSQHAWPQGFRVVADVVSRIEYTALAGTLSGMGMTPVLSDDDHAIVMISPIYESQRAARAFAEMVASLCRQAESKASPQVLALAAGALPSMQASYASDASYLSLHNAQALMRDAQILDYASEAGRALVKRGDGAVLLLQEQGRREPLYVARVPEVIAGALSHDGNIVALSTAQEKVVLYQKGHIVKIGEPLSGPTRTLAWTQENLLYFMNGNPSRFYWTDPKQAFDAEITPRLADQHSGLDGRLIGRRDRLYLQGEQQEIIYRCNPADASRSVCALGYRFDVSQDGSSMVVQTDEGMGTGLKIVNLDESADEQLIGLGLDLHDFCISHDGEYVFYLTKQGGGCALYRYGPCQ